MRKLKLVCALILAILMMVSCAGMGVLAEQGEPPTENTEKIEAPNADTPKEATQKAEEPKQEPPKKEEIKTEAPKEEPKQESSKGEETGGEPKQESPKTQNSGAETPQTGAPKSEPPKGEENTANAGAKNDAQSESDPDIESTNSDSSEDKSEPQRKVFEITFVIDGDRTIVRLSEGEAIAKPKNDPEKSGYNFVHWYDASGSEQTDFGFNTGAKKDLTLKALFKKIESDAEDQGEVNADGQQQETTIEDEEVPLSSGIASDPVEFNESKTDRSIVIVSDRGDTVQYGDAVTLTGKLSGFDGEQYSLTWRHDNGSGAWTDYSQGSANCTFVLDEHSANWNWQLVAVIDG